VNRPVTDARTAQQGLGPAWFGLTLATILWGLVALWVQWSRLTAPTGWWAIDSRRVLDVTGVWLAGGDPYSVYGFVYSPFAVLVALPFRVVGEWSWFAVEVAALVWIMLDSSKGVGWPSRAMVVLAGLLFLPVMSDLQLGNVTIVLSALGLIAIRSNRVGSGLAFGVALAAVPKPLFVPLLLWMLRYRRQSLAGTIAGGLIASAVGVVVMGQDRYLSFLSTLAAGGGLPSDFVGNLGLSSVSPTLSVIGNIVALGAVSAGIVFLTAESSLMVASLSGVFMGTYAGLYSAVPMLIGLPVFAKSYGRRALAIAGLSFGFLLAMPLMAAASMVVGAVPLPRRRRQTESVAPVSVSTLPRASGAPEAGVAADRS
jgi:hypothetical protein